MRFGLVHRVMTDALAVLGVLAVLTTGTLSTAATVVVLGGLAFAVLMPESWQTKPWLAHVGTVGPVAIFLVQAARLVLGRSPLDVAIEFAALLQVVRISTRRGAAHDQQIIVLALLHFVAGTVLGGGLSYGLCFVGFLLVAPGALVLSHLRREVEGNYRQGARDRTGLPVDVPRILRSRRVVGRGFLATMCLLSLPIFVFTGALFLLFPRVGLSLLLLNHPRQGRMVGFSDHVDLGDVGVLRADASIALRFTVSDVPDPPPPRLTLRLRGTAFDQYDGRAWSRSNAERRPAGRPSEGIDTISLYRYPSVARDRRVTIDVEPIDPPVVFLPPRTVAVRFLPPPRAVLSEPLVVQRGPEGELRYGGELGHGVHYEAYLAGDREPLNDPLLSTERPRYLGVPDALPRRFADLAHAWTDGAPSSYQKAKILEERLRTEFRYDTTSPSGGKPQPLDHFLFESKAGHCEFFSTAMAIMLRELGIPSRNVTGFVGGTYNRFGRYYVVREGDAHSWVEAYVDEAHGWLTFDPTPTSAAQPLHETTGAWVYLRDVVEAMSQRWNRYVVGYDLKMQGRLLEGATSRYAQFRQRRGLDRGAVGKLTKPTSVAAGVVGLGVVAWVLWTRRKRRGDATKPPKPTAEEREALRAADLYRSLDAALAAIGLGRAPGVPPLRHAEAMAAKHPLGPEIRELTDTYLRARFGGQPFDDAAARAYAERVKKVRAYVAPRGGAGAET